MFRYGGRDNAADGLFVSGEAAISFMSSSACAPASGKEARFKWGTVLLPYHDDVIADAEERRARRRQPLDADRRKTRDRRRNTRAWRSSSARSPTPTRISGGTRRPATCRSPWPAYEKAKAEGYYTQNPGADAAILQLSRAEPTPNSARLPARRDGRDPQHHPGGAGEGAAGPADRDRRRWRREPARQRGAAELRAGEQGLRPGEGAALPGPTAKGRKASGHL